MGNQDDKNENKIKIHDGPDSLSSDQMEQALFQMKNCVCKIELSNGGIGTGFFCKIPSSSKSIDLPVLMTCNHVLNKDKICPGQKIIFSLNNGERKYSIEISNLRKTYTDIEKDVTIIKLNPEKDNINEESFLHLDKSIYKDEPNKTYKNTTVYIIHYENGEKVKYSLGTIKNISENNHNIVHSCATETGSSGGPIINLLNSNVIGIQKGGRKFNLGTLIKSSIEEYNELGKIKLQFQVKCKKLCPGRELFITGNSKELGGWELENSHRLYCKNDSIWSSGFISFIKKDFEYKYIIKPPEDNNRNHVVWELFDFSGNRKLKLSTFKDGLFLIDDGNFNDKTNQKIININENEKDK